MVSRVHEEELRRSAGLTGTTPVGDLAPVWSKLPGTDGKRHSLEDLKEFKAVVVVALCLSQSPDFRAKVFGRFKSRPAAREAVAA